MSERPPHLCRFIRRAVEGVQRPPIFEADDGCDYVLKLDTEDPDFPAAELVSAGLAHPLGIRLPAWRVLVAPAVLVDAMSAAGDPDLLEFAESLTRKGGACFGSRYLSGVTVKWGPHLRRRVQGADEILADLLVFDAFIENGDRVSATNPNLLVCNGVLYAIDHGQALPSVQGITGKSLPFPYDSHLAWSVVRERPALLQAPIERLRRLTDEAIDAAIDAVPDAWWSAGERPLAVRDALRRRRDALPGRIEQLMERLR